MWDMFLQWPFREMTEQTPRDDPVLVLLKSNDLVSKPDEALNRSIIWWSQYWLWIENLLSDKRILVDMKMLCNKPRTACKLELNIRNRLPVNNPAYYWDAV